MNAVTDNEPTAALINHCSAALADAMAETDGIIFAMTATVDGLDVASIAAQGWDVPAGRLAAMASSGHALGDTVAAEITDSDCQNVIIDANRVSIIFMSVPNLQSPPLILCIAATKTASLGNVLHGARSCARRIGAFDPSVA